MRAVRRRPLERWSAPIPKTGLGPVRRKTATTDPIARSAEKQDEPEEDESRARYCLEESETPFHHLSQCLSER